MIRVILVSVMFLSAGVEAISEAVPQFELVHKAYIPSPERIHGEVRLLRYNHEVCLQILLFSPSLRRGLRAMREKELHAWPANRPGFEDSSRYLEALDRARVQILRQFERRADTTDLRQKMLIELFLSANDSYYVLSALEIKEEKEGVAIDEKSPLVVATASHDYVQRAMALMAKEAFGPLDDHLRGLLGLE